MKISLITTTILTALIPMISLAAGSGGSSLGIGIITTSPSQNDLEAHINSKNTTTGQFTNKFGSGLEFAGYYQYRFSSSAYAIQFRPSYFMQSASGGGSTYSLSAFTFFPMIRIHLLENNVVKFFIQAGLGYGMQNGKVDQPGASLSFKSDAFGAAGGLGAAFCFTPAHCAVVEGNLRYLPFQRNVITATSGTITPAGGTADEEFELNNRDIKTSMSGIQGGLMYQFNF